MANLSFTKDILFTREWLEAIGVLVAGLLAVILLKRFLSKIRVRPQWAFLTELIPYILNLGYVIALSVFIQAAPLGHRSATWAENASYVLTVCVLLSLVRQTF